MYRIEVMEEDEITERFTSYLKNKGYTITCVSKEKKHGPDIVAISSAGRRLVAEVKKHRSRHYGRPNAGHIDYPTVVGQIVERMESPESDYAIVIEEAGREYFAHLFSEYAMKRIGASVYAVSKDGTVTRIMG